MDMDRELHTDRSLKWTLCVVVVATQLTEYPVNLRTQMFFNWITQFYLTQFLFPFTQFYFCPEIKRQNRVITYRR